MVKVDFMNLALAALITSAVAPPVQKPPALPPPLPSPPNKPKDPKAPGSKTLPEKPPGRRDIFQFSHPLINLIASPDKAVEGNNLDKAYNLAFGTTESCLDAVFHGEEKLQLDVGADFVILKNAPKECGAIVDEVCNRPENKDLKEEDKIASRVGPNAIQFRGFNAAEMELFANVDGVFFNVHLV